MDEHKQVTIIEERPWIGAPGKREQLGVLDGKLYVQTVIKISPYNEAMTGWRPLYFYEIPMPLGAVSSFQNG